MRESRSSCYVKQYRGQTRSYPLWLTDFVVYNVDKTLVCINGINCSARHAFFAFIAFVIVLTLTTSTSVLLYQVCMSSCCICAYRMFCMSLQVVAGRVYVVWYEWCGDVFVWCLLPALTHCLCCMWCRRNIGMHQRCKLLRKACIFAFHCFRDRTYSYDEYCIVVVPGMYAIVMYTRVSYALHVVGLWQVVLRSVVRVVSWCLGVVRHVADSARMTSDWLKMRQNMLKARQSRQIQEAGQWQVSSRVICTWF